MTHIGTNTMEAAHSSATELCRILTENRAGKGKSIYSVCSAHRLVLEAAFAQARKDNSPLLIEATCNQVNQDGGYTGLTPCQFREYVESVARDLDFPLHRLILGGDHLGPNPWRSEPAAVAMEKACIMVAAYAAAGFGKIHLDASMACAGDPAILSNAEIAERAARLCEAAEASTQALSERPLYVIGTEVPTPGGAQEEMHISITTTLSLKETLDVHREAFARRNLQSAWERVIAVVVQPGVEFGDDAVADYIPAKASELSRYILEQERIVYEAHSTDYQMTESLRQLVKDHFGILKVGPELTFAMREAVFALARIEEESIPDSKRSNIRTTIDRVMTEKPKNWKPYYRGDELRLKVARAFSFSDRIRYYWPDAEVSASLDRLIQNLTESPPPLPVVSQYLPRQAEAIRKGMLDNNPRALIRHRIQESLARYASACGLQAG
ncbi:MAG: D-tagatose-bisphosphate aldolase, class II, non-catalytic subunit [Acidobacteria bacterium]|nr:D-tagatose-bisphosphate aldolase, class II, non-catalytic subunit [Acidobacteriota bacterium]